MNEISEVKYAVLMRPGAAPDEGLLAGVRAALERVEGVSVTDLNAPVALGMNHRDAVLTALITYSVTVAANLTSAAIQARFQEALSGQPDTQGVVIEEVLPDDDPPIETED